MPRPVYVEESWLRDLFNSEGYWERVKVGAWSEDILEDGHPSPELSAQPYCTRSQLVAYLDESGDEIVRVHQYKLRDGSLGGSGKPDPKAISYQGRLYAVWEEGRRNRPQR